MDDICDSMHWHSPPRYGTTTAPTIHFSLQSSASTKVTPCLDGPTTWTLDKKNTKMFVGAMAYKKLGVPPMIEEEKAYIRLYIVNNDST
jgi:hypothetical protein